MRALALLSLALCAAPRAAGAHAPQDAAAITRAAAELPPAALGAFTAWVRQLADARALPRAERAAAVHAVQRAVRRGLQAFREPHNNTSPTPPPDAAWLPAELRSLDGETLSNLVLQIDTAALADAVEGAEREALAREMCAVGIGLGDELIDQARELLEETVEAAAALPAVPPELAVATARAAQWTAALSAARAAEADGDLDAARVLRREALRQARVLLAGLGVGSSPDAASWLGSQLRAADSAAWAAMLRSGELQLDGGALAEAVAEVDRQALAETIAADAAESDPPVLSRAHRWLAQLVRRAAREDAPEPLRRAAQRARKAVALARRAAEEAGREDVEGAVVAESRARFQADKALQALGIGGANEPITPLPPPPTAKRRAQRLDALAGACARLGADDVGRARDWLSDLRDALRDGAEAERELEERQREAANAAYERAHDGSAPPATPLLLRAAPTAARARGARDDGAPAPAGTEARAGLELLAKLLSSPSPADQPAAEPLREENASAPSAPSPAAPLADGGGAAFADAPPRDAPAHTGAHTRARTGALSAAVRAVAGAAIGAMVIAFALQLLLIRRAARRARARRQPAALAGSRAAPAGVRERLRARLAGVLPDLPARPDVGAGGADEAEAGLGFYGGGRHAKRLSLVDEAAEEYDQDSSEMSADEAAPAHEARRLAE